MLSYIIDSVFQAIKITLHDELKTINLDRVPTVAEKQILQVSLVTYIINSMRKNKFTPFKEIVTKNIHRRNEQKQQDLKNLT